MKRVGPVILGAFLAAILLAVLGSTIVTALTPPQAFPPEAGLHPDALTTRRTLDNYETINLSPSTPSGDQIGAVIGTGPGGQVMPSDPVLLLTDKAASSRQLAAEWIAQHHPGLKVSMWLHPQGHLEGFTAPIR